MTARFWTNVGRLAGLALVALVLVPAAAGAAAFQTVGPAPGGDDLAVIKGVPYVAYATSGGVRVAKLTNGNVWQQVGGAIRHQTGRATSSPSLTGDPSGVPWIVWTERDAGGTTQARVARFSNGSWQEVVGGARPINLNIDPDSGPSGAYYPRIVFFAARPYVVYVQDTPSEFELEVVRLSADGSKWDHVDSPFVTRPGPPRVAVSGNRFYIAVEDVLAPGFRVFRMNSSGKWDDLFGSEVYEFVGDIADVGGAPVIGYSSRSSEDQSSSLRALALGADGSSTPLDSAASTFESDIDAQGVAGDGSVPYVSGLRGSELVVSRFVNGAWEPIDSPSSSATSAQLAPGSTGGIWLLYGQSSGGTTTHYLATLGATLPADGPSPGPPEPTPTGHCAKTINGTAASDLLRGTHLGDSLFGFGGNDTVRAYAGSDCLFGGSGNDYLSGGKGNDYFEGGAGNDTMYGGDGNDDLNGNGGNDRISGGRGEDQVAAGAGDDRVDVSQQGADLVDCGSGRDTVVITRIDGYRNCERVIIKR